MDQLYNNINSNSRSLSASVITKQKQRTLKTLLHTDSLSSDPSDYQSLPGNRANYKSDFQNSLNEMNNISGSSSQRKPTSAKKRTTRTRKQPSLPNGTGATSLQQQQQLKQQLLHKILLKQNLKQHSLTSSDENLIDEFESKSFDQNPKAKKKIF